MDNINSVIKSDINKAVKLATETDKYLGMLLSKINNIRVMLTCNWCSSKDLCDLWNKMSKGNYTWNKIQIVYEEPYDYLVIINTPNKDFNKPIFKDKTILFHMEPVMTREVWGDWAVPNYKDFLKVFDHKSEYNNNEWHISKTYSELTETSPKKSFDTEISTVLSDKYRDPGHIKRVDFVKFLDTKNDLTVHVYGSNKHGYKNYKKSLPYHCKDDALLPYRYTINVENHSMKNYYTEKLIDGILSETLVFYNGCVNIKEFIHPRAYVWLELTDFNKDYTTIKNAISNNLWMSRLPYIKKAKQKILNHYAFFPRIERLLIPLQSYPDQNQESTKVESK